MLSIESIDGSKIAAVDVSLSGQFHQRWSLSEDTGAFEPTPAGYGAVNGDSHLMPGNSALLAVAPYEDNNIYNDNPLAAPLSDTATSDYGVGSTLSGVWGVLGAEQAASLDLAQIVIRAARRWMNIASTSTWPPPTAAVT